MKPDPVILSAEAERQIRWIERELDEAMDLPHDTVIDRLYFKVNHLLDEADTLKLEILVSGVSN